MDTPLHASAQNGDAETVKALIAQGVPLSAFDELDKTPLHYAAEAGHLDVMCLLIDAGADVNAHNEARVGNTPLREVASNCSFEVAELLVRAGADPTIPGWMGLTALHKAADRKKPEGVKVYEFLRRAAERPRKQK